MVGVGGSEGEPGALALAQLAGATNGVAVGLDRDGSGRGERRRVAEVDRDGAAVVLIEARRGTPVVRAQHHRALEGDGAAHASRAADDHSVIAHRHEIVDLQHAGVGVHPGDEHVGGGQVHVSTRYDGFGRLDVPVAAVLVE